jgi:hypothetical protein
MMQRKLIADGHDPATVSKASKLVRTLHPNLVHDDRDEYNEDLRREEGDEYLPWDESNSEPDDRSCDCS